MRLLDALTVILAPGSTLETLETQRQTIARLATENAELRDKLSEVNALGIRLSNGRYTTR